MNDFLQQLMSMGPAIGAGVGGNGEAMQAFMEGYQRTMAQLEMQKRAQTRDQMDQQEMQMRQQQMTQQQSDRAAAEARAAEDQQWQNTQRRFEVAGALGSAADTAETPAQGESAIDARFRLLQPGLQAEMAGVRDSEIRNVAAKVTSRQKNELRRWIREELEKSEFAGPAEDGDITAALQKKAPRIYQLMQQLTGKTSFLKSDIYQAAETLEQVQPAKTRIPAAAGSMEEFSDPATAPERKAQILADRKAYMQSDDRPPSVNVNVGQGAHPPAVQRRIDAIVKGFDSNPVVQRTQKLAEAAQLTEGLDMNTSNPADDQALIYAFAKVMDPESVVREGEYNTVQKYAQSWADTFGFDAQRIFSNTAFLTPQARQQLKTTIMAKFNAGRGQYENIRNEFGRRIERITGKPGGVDELTDYGGAFPAAAAGNRPKRGVNPFRQQ